MLHLLLSTDRQLPAQQGPSPARPATRVRPEGARASPTQPVSGAHNPPTAAVDLEGRRVRT